MKQLLATPFRERPTVAGRLASAEEPSVAEAQIIEATEAGAKAKVAAAGAEAGEEARKRRDSIDAAGRDPDQAGEAVEVAEDDKTALEALEDPKGWRLAVILQDDADTGAECSQERREIALVAEATFEAIYHVFTPFD